MNTLGRGQDAGERQRQMKELAIGFDGSRYEACGYRYDRLEDAVNYARMVREREGAGLRPPLIPVAYVDLPPRAPTVEELAVMKDLAITMNRGLFEYRGYRYDRLADAVSYADHLRCKSSHDL